MPIREAKLTDHAQLEALREQGGLTRESQTAFARRLLQADVLYRVLQENSESPPIGFYSARFLPPEAELLELAVANDFRRRGLGALLLRDFLAVGCKRGCRRFFLEVGVGNVAARTLYEKIGFRVCGCRPGYYRAASTGGDALVMALELPEGETVEP
ncbi:MAG: hypothetical protein Kow00109_25110 [Acidobacteriota bacterium]